MDARGLRPALGLDVDAKLALPAFDRLVDLARRHVEALGDDEEVVDERVHVRLHRFAFGEDDLRRVGLGGAGAQTVERLPDELVRLDHLAHTDEIARPDIAAALYGNVEVAGLIARIRVDAADVDGHAAAAQGRPGQAPVNRVLRRDNADALRAALEDSVAGEQVVKLRDGLRKIFGELARAPLEARGQVHHQAADAEVGRRHPLARRGLDEVHDLLALAEAVEEDRHRADVERVRSQPDEVRADALQLAHEDADDLRAFRNLKAQKLLDGHAVGEVVAERVEVVHPVGDDDALLILLILEELLHPRVQVADVGRALDDHLAVEDEFEAQDAVGRRVLRPERDGHLRVERAVNDLERRRKISG